jgi:hypothetical protein
MEMRSSIARSTGVVVVVVVSVPPARVVHHLTTIVLKAAVIIGHWTWRDVVGRVDQCRQSAVRNEQS